ncbi:MAG: alpha/beta fold hydrolase [bacterium]|nr:alpha/beta fold hydrolase [bacterium]
MTILILHGIGGYAGIHWQKWLYGNLIKDGYKVIMPDLPKPDRPNRKDWLRAVQEIIKSVDSSDLIIVAHSLGVATALDLTEQLPVKALISVSGFASDYGAELNDYFLKEKIIDFKKVNKSLKQVFVIYGDNDPYVPQEVLKSLADSLNVKPEIIVNGGHLNTDSGYTVFPRLLEIIKLIK